MAKRAPHEYKNVQAALVFAGTAMILFGLPFVVFDKADGEDLLLPLGLVLVFVCGHGVRGQHRVGG